MNETSAKPNHSIHCTVDECMNHCDNENYCSLGVVTIGTHEPDPTLCQCIDCESFTRKDHEHLSFR